MSYLERLAAIQERGGRAVLFTVVEGDGLGTEFLVEEGGPEVRVRRRGRRGDPRGAQRTDRVRGRYRKDPRRGLHAAAAAVRLWRGRHRRGAVQGREAARLEDDRRRRPARIHDRRAVPERGRADRQVAARRRSPTSGPTTRPPSSCSPTTPRGIKPHCRASSRPRRSTSARSARAATRRSAAPACSRRASRRRRWAASLGPCGLDVGAQSQEETALSILGEILALRAGRPGGFLHDAKRGSTRRGHARSGVMDPGIQKVLDAMNALEGPVRARGPGRAGARRARERDRAARRPRRGGRQRSRTASSPACPRSSTPLEPASGTMAASTAAAGWSGRSARSTRPAGRSRTRRARRWRAAATGWRPSTRSRPRWRTASPPRACWAEPVAVAGDSAGGNLAVGVARRLRDQVARDGADLPRHRRRPQHALDAQLRGALGLTAAGLQRYWKPISTAPTASRPTPRRCAPTTSPDSRRPTS